MSIAEGPASYIFEGVWTNWAKGRVVGLTLTLSAHNANILSPVLANLVATAGGQLWRLFQFAIHQLRATPEPRNFLFWFQQIALRNTAIDINAFWRFIKFAFVFKHEEAIHSFKNSIPLITFTLFHIALVNLASSFTPTLLTAGNEVLSKGPFCGTYNDTYTTGIIYSNDTSTEALRLKMEFKQNVNSIFASVQQHVDICQTSLDGCDSTRPVKSLKSTATILYGKCPFDSSICHPDIEGALELDTGIISSHSHLGFNFPKEDQVAFRVRSLCAPLDNSRFVTGWQDIAATPERPAHQISDALFGRSFWSDRNATWSTVKQYLACEQRMVLPPYTLNVQHAAPGGSIAKGTADFDIIPELQLSDAETDLMLLAFNGAYEGPVLDPWFSARTPYNDSNAFCQNLNKQLYTRDVPITAMGCTSQWQICTSDTASHYNSTSCTPLLARRQLVKAVRAEPFVSQLNHRQKATIGRIFGIAEAATLNQVVNKLSQSTVAPLQARRNISDTVGPALPSNQWQTETQYWFDILLAYVQEISLQLGTGQFAASTEYINVTTKPSGNNPAQLAAYEICQSQIIRSQAYVNYNFFALIIIVSVCVIIIILGLFIEDIIGYIRKRRQEYTKYRQSSWNRDLDIEMQKHISILKLGTPWGGSSWGIPLPGAGSVACLKDLECNVLTAVEMQDVAHHHMIAAPPRSGLRSHPPAGISQERLIGTHTALNHSRHDSGTAEAVGPNLPEANVPSSQDDDDQTRHHLTAPRRHVSCTHSTHRRRSSFDTDLNDHHPDNSLSDDERNSYELHSLARPDYGDTEEHEASTRNGHHRPIIRLTPPSGSNLYSQYCTNADEPRSAPPSRPPSA